MEVIFIKWSSRIAKPEPNALKKKWQKRAAKTAKTEIAPIIIIIRREGELEA